MVAGDFALKPKQQQQKQTNKKKNKNKNKTKQKTPNQAIKTKKHISQSSFFHISSETKCFFLFFIFLNLA